MQPQGTKLDFTGQDIFVGLDVSNKNWRTSILTDQLVHRTFAQPPNVEALVSYLHRHFPGARYHCVYEAGYCGFWIHDQLQRSGIDCLVANPADVPTTHKEKAFKTDRIDARKLARSLRNGELEALYVPSRTAQEVRSLVRTRLSLVRKQTRCKNQIKAFLGYYGIALPEELLHARWSKRFLHWLEQITMEHTSGTQALRTLLDELKHLRSLVAQLTTQIHSVAQHEPYCRQVEYLSTIPGIKTLAAMTLLTEFIDIRRFHSLDHLASYVGLVPGEHSSGEIEHSTGISRRRNPFLRTVLIEAAWVAVRKDPALMMAFHRLSRRMPKNQAIVRIARKLLNRIHFVLKNQQPYRSCMVTSAP